jgi:hypothetical protein
MVQPTNSPSQNETPDRVEQATTTGKTLARSALAGWWGNAADRLIYRLLRSLAMWGVAIESVRRLLQTLALDWQATVAMCVLVADFGLALSIATIIALRALTATRLLNDSIRDLKSSVAEMEQSVSAANKDTKEAVAQAKATMANMIADAAQAISNAATAAANAAALTEAIRERSTSLEDKIKNLDATVRLLAIATEKQSSAIVTAVEKQTAAKVATGYFNMLSKLGIDDK